MKINKLIILSIFVSFSVINNAYSKSYCMSADISCKSYYPKIDTLDTKQRIKKQISSLAKSRVDQHINGVGVLLRFVENLSIPFGVKPQKDNLTANKYSVPLSEASHSQVNNRTINRISMEFPATRSEQLRAAKVVEHHSKIDSGDPKALLKAGRSALKIGDYAKAKKWLKELLEVRESEGKESLELADALHEMGSLYLSLGQYNKAAPLFLRALSLKEKKLTVEHPSDAKTRVKLGDLYKAKGEYNKAEAFYLRALAIYEKHSGLEEKMVADIWLNLGDIYLDQRHYDKAEDFYNRAIAINKKVRSMNHPIIARLYAKLAEVFMVRGDLKKAEWFYTESTHITKQTLGENHTAYARSMKQLADFYKKNTHYKNAEQMYLKVISVASRAFGAKHPFVAESFKNLSEVYEQLGAYDKAEEMKKKSLRAYK